MWGERLSGYLKDLRTSLEEVYRVLKKGRIVTLNIARKRPEDFHTVEEILSKIGFNWLHTHNLITTNPSYIQRRASQVLVNSFLVILQKDWNDKSDLIGSNLYTPALESLTRKSILQSSQMLLGRTSYRKKSGCALCSLLKSKSDETKIADLSVSVALVNFDQTYYGRTLVVAKNHEEDVIKGISKSPIMFFSFWDDVGRVGKAIQEALHPER